jgi:alpha-mannosidase
MANCFGFVTTKLEICLRAFVCGRCILRSRTFSNADSEASAALRLTSIGSRDEVARMVPRTFVLCLRGFLALLAAQLAQAAPPESTAKPTLYYIPHTHWEGAVFKTREAYLDMGLQNILRAMRLLKAYPDCKFTLDQVAYFKPFLERYPEQEADFRRFIAEGRLGIVGGMDVMPDDVKPGGELFVRQIQYGKQYCREKLGLEVTVAWLLDTFGHHPQIPQILKLAGYKSFWFCRGVPNDNMPSEFLWQGIDGSKIPAFWLPGFYGLFYGAPREYPQFKKFFQDRFDYLGHYTHASERVGLAGADVSEPEDHVPALLRQFNLDPAAAFKIRYAIPTDFEAVVSKRPDLPTLRGDFNPIFQGTYSSRAELKQRARNDESLLVTAEKLMALAGWLGAPPDPELAWNAWEPVLFNQTHDLASGTMTDTVYEDTVRGYEFAEHQGAQIIDTAWEKVAAQIDTRGEGVPIVVFNPLGWTRSDVAEVQIGLTETGLKDLRLIDSDGTSVPIQFLTEERYADGGLKQVRFTFLARDVPALGWATYHAIALRTEPKPGERSGEESKTPVLENEFYRVTVNPGNGAITSLFDKASQWEALAAPGNVVGRLQDKGDLWELYHGLDGGSFIAMTNQQPVPKHGQALFSSDEIGANGHLLRGPVFSEFTASNPLANGTFSTRIRLFAGSRRVDIQTDLVNNEKWVRYQALFPSTIQGGHNDQEIPFGAVERPVGIEFPAQNWMDYTDGQHGLALLNDGLPGNLVTDGTMMVSLMRSHNLGGYGYGGGYEPGMSSETGFELGRPLSFHYALAPHSGDWRQASVYRQGMELVQPLMARKAATHAGRLPARWGLLDISRTNVVLTALKPGPGQTTVLRVYEGEGENTTGVAIHFNARIAAACEANLLEDSGPNLKVEKNTVRFDLHPFEIKTIKLRLTPEKKSGSQ